MSVEEFVPKTVKKQLRQIPAFMFIVALRNLTTHHAVIATRTEPVAKFPRLFKRQVSVRVGGREEIGEARLLFDGDSFRETLTALQGDVHAKRWVADARRALETLEAQGLITFESIMAEGIDSLRALIEK